jgi:glycosyltransferase involved in cell wall biosynthesis
MRESPNVEIRFRGWVDDFSVIEDCLARSHCMVIPSKLSQPEGLPRVLEEAVAIGTPIICSTHVSMASFARERDVRGVEWLRDDSVDAISEALEAISKRFLDGELRSSRPGEYVYVNAASTAIKHLEWIGAGERTKESKTPTTE